MSLLLGSLMFGLGCGVDDPPPPPPIVATVEVTPPSTTLTTILDTVRLVAVARDQANAVIEGRVVTWSSSNAGTATIGGTGLVTAKGNGVATMTATIDSVAATAQITVAQQAATVTVTPGNPQTLTSINDTVALTPEAADARGYPLPSPVFAWTSTNPAAATVSADGIVVARGGGSASIVASIGLATDTVRFTVDQRVASVTLTAAPTTAMPLTGTVQLTAVLRDARTNLVNRTPTWTSFNTDVANVNTSGLVTPTGVSLDSVTIRALSGTASSQIALWPEVTFASMSPATGFTCAVTTAGAGYCWGFGATGDGLEPFVRRAPRRVLSTKVFRSVSAAGDGYSSRACALDADSLSYCWGDAFVIGQPDDLDPVAVPGAHRFRSIGLSSGHVCGLKADGTALCWGSNSGGVLGDGTETPRSTPTAVVGGLAFTSLFVGGHTCGLVASGAAHCWGGNGFGQLGDDTSIQRSTPTAVLGGLQFKSLAVGVVHTCGITTSDATYCWGYNAEGGLGTGNTLHRSVPTAVGGGIVFQQLAAGYTHTCGIAVGGAAYCWGDNTDGKLGNGTTTRSLTPTPVSGGITFASISVGRKHSCGISTNGVAYCWGSNISGLLGVTGEPNVTGPRTPTRVRGSKRNVP